MIKFDRKDNEVRVKVNDGITNTNWVFTHQVNHNSEAEICKRHFNEKFRDKVREIREKAYEKGYKEGRHHGKKDKTFSPWMANDTVGWKY